LISSKEKQSKANMQLMIDGQVVVVYVVPLERRLYYMLLLLLLVKLLLSHPIMQPTTMSIPHRSIVALL
jgi:hypothetical protein